MRHRLVMLLPVLVCSIALGRAADAWDLALLLVAVASALSLIGPRWELDLGRQLVTSAMGAGVGYASASMLYELHGPWLGEGFTRIAAAFVLAGAARFLVVGGGRIGLVVLLFLSLLATGETRVPGYPIAVGVFLVTSLAALRADPARPDGRAVSLRRLLFGVTLLGAAAGLATGAIVGVRSLQAWLVNRSHLVAFQWQPRVGFSDRMDLGALEGLLDSDTLVLRVRGPRVDHLRGGALDFYESGRWLRSDAAERETKQRLTEEPRSAHPVEITALSERVDRFFVPLNARSIGATPPSVQVDGLGAMKRATKHGPSSVQFELGPRDQGIPTPPSPSDLQVPRRIRAELMQIAREWTGNADTPSKKLDAIELRLQRGFRYARSVERPAHRDPALDFLLWNKRGHCEYFASAMALVARAAGIPARVVTGYRVGERSPFGYYVVRERNAHAWVEAWVPGVGWTTRDPTPEAFLPQNREHRASYAASLFDALSVGYDGFTDWLGGLTLGQTAIAWLLGLLVLAWIVARGARRRRTNEVDVPSDEAPLPWLEPLLAELARSGHSLRPSEPLEQLAARIPDAAARALLVRYAALRYGGEGDPRELARDVLAYTPPSASEPRDSPS